MTIWGKLYEIIEQQLPNAIRVADATSAGVDIAGFPQKTPSKSGSLVIEAVVFLCCLFFDMFHFV